MKKTIGIFLVLIMLIGLCACGTTEPEVNNSITIPDVVEVDQTSGLNALSSLGFIPKVEEMYDDNIEAGYIIKCYPACGANVEKGSKVTVYVSKGASTISAKSSYMNWTYITHGVEDDWEFRNPYIEEGVLYLHCHNVTFGTAMEWRDRYDKGHASGTASINDTFDKVIPVTLEYSQRTAKANESQDFTIEVPLADLDVDKPTDLYFRIGITANGEDTNLYFNISMTW